MFWVLLILNVLVCSGYLFALLGLQLVKNSELGKDDTYCEVDYLGEMLTDIAMGLMRVVSNGMIIYSTF